MKLIKRPFVVWLALLVVCATACQQDPYTLETDIVQLGSLEAPSSNSAILINPEKDSSVTFSWSSAQAADGGLVLYRVLFDVEGGDFSHPIYALPADNKGGRNALTLSPVYLNIIASKAGIKQLETGKVSWTVEASSGYHLTRYTESMDLVLTRPEGLAEFPRFMYIFGEATEAEQLTEGVAFKEISPELPTDEIKPGVFESITLLKAGDYFIADANHPDSTVHYYYLNEEGKLRSGQQPTAFTLPEGVYRVRMNLSLATVTFEAMSAIELYILANQTTKATLTYVGDHTFRSTEGYFDFLTTGAPEAPDWLGWEEERYRFRVTIGGQESYLGSYHNADMNGSLVEGQQVYNVRPDGQEPASYYFTYFLGPDAEYWQGAWKFADSYNGAPFTVSVVFDPKADHYYHEFKRN
ncbi:SusE outer membrane protein [Catalinimonas alkaloidigena]|uniref:SusE outer membrane protein n=1 Tax=Catalinimonas alkaloidigena TaxID=1075417 RepID=A0A1G9TPY2_9BACT|nr:SusE domain-containing protein [Catalinimonas alkaloidigena]SDM49494.1 SusE outer membrane protein [Catalinimonas alkaloidigena]